jgi:hypothetical protein
MPLTIRESRPGHAPSAIAELDGDLAAVRFTPPTASPTAIADYQRLLRDALSLHDDLWLEAAERTICSGLRARDHAPRRTDHLPRFPKWPPRMLAEGDFQRYYMRGVRTARDR